MDIRNNILRDLKSYFIKDLLDYYDNNEAESLVSIIIEHFIGTSRIDMAINPTLRISESEILVLHQSVKELKKMKPVQYITGVVEFQGLEIHVNNNVLIPRQETEELVNLVLRNEVDDNLEVLDIGTGSGCIAISVFKKLDNPNVSAIDISQGAIELARENAVTNNTQIDFAIHDILNSHCELSIATTKFDVIISNPPYVTASDKEKMQPNVLDYEPHEALFVPENNPLIYYNAILKFAKHKLTRKGRVYFEINETYAEEVKELLIQYEYFQIVIHKDIHSKDRFISAIKN